MLELKKITKIYKVGELEQKALSNVSINFRKNEFASILGPSGSGKTTLLNIIGGLDNYSSGDLVINEISTKKYKDFLHKLKKIKGPSPKSLLGGILRTVPQSLYI